MLTGLKSYEFKIWIDGTEWVDKWSFGAKKAVIIKAIPIMKKEFGFTNLFSHEDVDIQSLMFRSNGVFKSFTCPRNFWLERAIAMWNLYNLGFPPFDYLSINGRRVPDYKYNVETVDFLGWNQMFVENSLKEGSPVDEYYEENFVRIAKGYLIWIWKGSKEVFFGRLRAGDRRMNSFIELIANLEFNKIITPEKEAYIT
jgi:hypothetical protein